MSKAIAYYRVSTDKQGLGIEAQRTIVHNWAKSKGVEIVEEYSEKVSGKDDDRQELIKAKESCIKNGATLVVAKLDRLSRHAKFIFELFDDLAKRGLSFSVCNLPDLTPLTLGIFAGLAQQEREMISERTRQALQAKKEKGEKLGREFTQTDLQKAHANSMMVRGKNARSNQDNKIAYQIAKPLSIQGMNPNAIAKHLNEIGCKTRRGNKWSREGVVKLLKMMA